MIVWRMEREGASQLMYHEELLSMFAGDVRCICLIEAMETFSVGFTTYRIMKVF